MASLFGTRERGQVVSVASSRRAPGRAGGVAQRASVEGLHDVLHHAHRRELAELLHGRARPKRPSWMRLFFGRRGTNSRQKNALEARSTRASIIVRSPFAFMRAQSALLHNRRSPCRSSLTSSASHPSSSCRSNATPKRSDSPPTRTSRPSRSPFSSSSASTPGADTVNTLFVVDDASDLARQRPTTRTTHQSGFPRAQTISNRVPRLQNKRRGHHV